MQHWRQEMDFSVQKIKTQTFKKANLKAELAFPYEVKNVQRKKLPTGCGYFGKILKNVWVNYKKQKKIDPNFRPTVV